MLYYSNIVVKSVYPPLVAPIGDSADRLCFLSIGVK